MPTLEEEAASKVGTEAADLWASAAKEREGEAKDEAIEDHPCEQAAAWAKASDDYAAAAAQESSINPRRASYYSNKAAEDAKEAAEAFERCGNLEDHEAVLKPIGRRPWVRAKLYWTRASIHYGVLKQFWYAQKQQALQSGDEDKKEACDLKARDAERRETTANRGVKRAEDHLEE